jgi:hypothetical protein
MHSSPTITSALPLRHEALRKACIAGCAAAVAELRTVGSRHVTLDEIRSHLLLVVCAHPAEIAELATAMAVGSPTQLEETDDGEPVFAVR